MTLPGDTRHRLLRSLYGDRADEVHRRLDQIIDAVPRRPRSPGWDERSAWIIAYPDQFRADGAVPLATLRSMIADHLQPDITGVHVLPWHPSSSDGGFSITSFDRIDPSFGTWDDVRALAASTDLMADVVVNHASAHGDWFRGFLADDPDYRDFFRTVDPGADLTSVVRPRSSPVTTTFERADGTPVSVWTTFSADQVDLDYRNPEVLVRMVEVVLDYVSAGARALRLDAVAYLWKSEGTSSIHLRETHQIVQLLRACVDEVDPGVVLVTETNVPHHENISYFGPPGVREAQAVYQFPLPPLVLHAFVSGSAVELRAWADELRFDRDDTTFMNFLASHDGIGLRPVEGLLDARQRSAVRRVCQQAGGQVNTRRLPDGTDVAYELTGTWFAHLAAGHDEDAGLDRHVASHAVALALRGVPLLYTHSLFASDNDLDAYARSGHGRDLNRARLSIVDLERRLAAPDSREARCWTRMKRMLRTRASCRAFHPSSLQEVIDAPDGLFVVRRRSSAGEQAVVAVNVSGEAAELTLPDGRWIDVDGASVERHRMTVPRWSSVWLTSAS